MNLENLRQLAALHARGTLLTDEAVRELVDGVDLVVRSLEAIRRARLPMYEGPDGQLHVGSVLMTEAERVRSVMDESVAELRNALAWTGRELKDGTPCWCRDDGQHDSVCAMRRRLVGVGL